MQGKPFNANETQKNTRPQVKTTNRTKKPIIGYIANSMNAGHNRPIAWQYVMKDTRVKQDKITLNIKMLTPKNPAYQRLHATLRTYKVPMKRVFKNFDRFLAQSPADEDRPLSYPNIKYSPKGNKRRIPMTGNLNNNEKDGYQSAFNSLWYRDTFASCYLPVVGSKEKMGVATGGANGTGYLPDFNACILRGSVAIYNDFERNKEYQDARPEYDGDNVTDEEMKNYFPVSLWHTNQSRNTEATELDRSLWEENGALDYYQRRACKPRNYYSNYRINAQGFAELAPTTEELNKNYEGTNIPNQVNGEGAFSYVKWDIWERKAQEALAQAENANKNVWDIIAQLRGGSPAQQNEVQLIGENTFDLNYKSVTQSTYNANSAVQERYQALGEQGAYSYTEIEVPTFAGYVFDTECILHYTLTVWADPVYERAIDRTAMNVKWDQIYRPDLAKDEYDTLLSAELSVNYPVTDTTNDHSDQAIGYKRKYTEYYKLPNCIAGDMVKENWLMEDMEPMNLPIMGNYAPTTELIGQGTFTFFETSVNTTRNVQPLNDGNDISNWNGKQIYFDYTDLQINDNQAYKNDLYCPGSDYNNSICVDGNNQIFFVGTHEQECILPMDNIIETNFQEWGGN